MDSRYLKEYLLFASELNYTTASKKLFITRPTLSEHVAELERELGCQLVHKDHGRVELTAEGKRFAITAEELLGRLDEVIEEYSAMADNLLTVRIATSNLPWIESYLYRARRLIRERYPGKEIEITTVNGTFSNADALGDCRNDLVVAGFKRIQNVAPRATFQEGDQGFKLCTEDVRFLVLQGNPLFKQDSVSVKDLDGATLLLPPDIYNGYVRADVAQKFAEAGARISLQTERFNDHHEYFATDFREKVGVVPSTLVSRFGLTERKDCKVFSLCDFSFASDFYVVYRDEFLANPNARLLVETMKNLVGEA